MELETKELNEMAASRNVPLDEAKAVAYLNALLARLDKAKVTTNSSWTLLAFALQSSFIAGGSEVGDALFQAIEARSEISEDYGVWIADLISVSAGRRDPKVLISDFSQPDWIGYVLAATSMMVAARINSTELMQAALRRLELYENIELIFAKAMHKVGSIWVQLASGKPIIEQVLETEVHELIEEFEEIKTENMKGRALLTLRVLLPDYTASLGPTLPLPLAPQKEAN